MATQKPEGTSTMPRRAYSYSRVSQYHTGSTSIERQETFAETICREEGWTLDDTLVFVDKGRSAFRGKNRTATGDLTRCLNAIESGRIAPGSVLIVENIDRLSRQEVDTAYDLFRSILKAGVWLATEQPRRIYRPGPQDFIALLEPLWQMYLAHNESAKKSMRIGEEWVKGRRVARETGRPSMHHGPCWCRRTADGWTPIPEVVGVLVRMCNLLAKGMGTGRVAALFNREEVPAPRGGTNWRGSSILRMVRGNALLGEWQPCRMIEGKQRPEGDPLPGFYPAAVSPELLGQVHDQLGQRKRTGGRPAGPGGVNVLRGVAFERSSGRSLALQNVTDAYGKRAYLFVAGCTGGMRVSYPVVLETILATVRQLTPADVLPPDLARDAKEARMTELGKRIGGLTSRQRVISASLADPDQEGAPLLDALAIIKRDLEEAVSERNRLQQETRSGRAEALGEAQSLVALRAAATEEERRRIDEALLPVLPLFVSRVEVERERVTRTAQIVRLTISLRGGAVRQVTVGP